MGQDQPGVLLDGLGSKNRARAESIALKAFLSVKKTSIPVNTYKRGQNGDKTGTLGDICMTFLGVSMTQKFHLSPVQEKKPL